MEKITETVNSIYDLTKLPLRQINKNNILSLLRKLQFNNIHITRDLIFEIKHMEILLKFLESFVKVLKKKLNSELELMPYCNHCSAICEDCSNLLINLGSYRTIYEICVDSSKLSSTESTPIDQNPIIKAKQKELVDQFQLLEEEIITILDNIQEKPVDKVGVPEIQEPGKDSSYDNWDSVYSILNQKLSFYGKSLSSTDQSTVKVLAYLLESFLPLGIIAPVIPTLNVDEKQFESTTLSTTSENSSVSMDDTTTKDINDIKHTELEIKEVTQLKVDLRHYEIKINDLEKEKNLLKEETDRLRLQLEAVEDQKKGLVDLSKDFDAKLSELRKDYKEDISHLITQLQDSIVLNARSQEEISSLRRQLNHLNNKPRDVEEKLMEELRTTTNQLQITLREKMDLLHQFEGVYKSHNINVSDSVKQCLISSTTVDLLAYILRIRCSPPVISDTPPPLAVLLPEVGPSTPEASVTEQENIDFIKPNRWFEEITGCPEKEFRKIKSQIVVMTGEGYLCLRNIKTGKITSAGILYYETLGSLLQSVMNQVFSYSDNKSSPEVKRSRQWLLNTKQFLQRGFEVDILTTGLPSLLKKDQLEYVPFEIITREEGVTSKSVDVAHLQALKENKEAVFQVSSNFNGIEAITERTSPELDNFTEQYWLDKTQGPIASISTGAAAIARVHCAFSDPTKDISLWGQSKTRQLNFLENLKEHFPHIKNGYIKLSGQEPKFPRVDSKEYYKLLLSSKICYHKNCQVTSGYYTNNGFERIKDKNQVIDQCLCAAINISQGPYGRQNAGIPDIQTKCRFALDTAYTGIYLGCIVNKRSKIYLNMVGGGAFGNQKEWIFNSIITAHKKWGVKGLSTIQRVYLIIWNRQQLSTSFLEELQKEGIPFLLKENS